MRNSFAAGSGPRLVRTPSSRQRSARRRWMAAGGVIALALISGAIGRLTANQAPQRPVETGPFSYFPYQ